MSSRAARLLLSALVVAATAATIGFGTLAAFSSTTTNAGDSVEAGTVLVGDNDAGSAMLDLAAANGGDSDTSCIAITYSGTLPATVRLYGSVTGAITPYITLTVTRGTDSSPSFDSCGTFTPDATDYIGAGPGVVYSGLVSDFPTTYDGGIVDPVSGSPESWTQAESHSYRFTVTLSNDEAAQGKSGSAGFTWEARNS